MTDYSIKLTVQKDITIGGSQVGDYIYNEEEKSLSFSLPYPFPCKFKVINLEQIIVTPWMLRLPSFLKYHNIEFLRQQLMQIECIKQGYLLLHGSAWRENGHGYLAVGFPNSGKTLAVLRAVSNGAEFCSDENILYKDGIAYSVKRHTSLSPWVADAIGYPLTRKQKWDFFCAGIKAKLFPIFEPNIWVDLYYERKNIQLDEIIFLTDSLASWAIPPATKMEILTTNEFPFMTNPVIQTWAYATGWNLDAYCQKYRSLIETLCANTKC